MSLDDCGMVCAGVVDGGASRYVFRYAEYAASIVWFSNLL
jgi:hypothetical protein